MWLLIRRLCCQGVAQLREAVWSARRVATAESDPSVVLDQLIQEVGYLDWVMEGRCGEGDEEQRWQNVEQLLDTLKELPVRIVHPPPCPLPHLPTYYRSHHLYSYESRYLRESRVTACTPAVALYRERKYACAFAR